METLSAVLLLRARTHARLSQRALADRAGTSPAAIAFIESGRRDPTVSTLERLLEVCGMELNSRELPLSERLQLDWDRQVGHQQAAANAARARSEVRAIRPLSEVGHPSLRASTQRA
jgi:transcriptional regulator with XRE-family HTH domain